MEVPFDSQDIAIGRGSFKQDVNGYSSGKNFICLYDKQHSLRLSGELLAEDTLRKVLARALEMCETGAFPRSLRETLELLSIEASQPKMVRESSAIPCDERFVRILLPGETGIDISRDNSDFHVTRVFFHPTFQLSYRGVHATDAGRAQGRSQNGDADTIISIDRISPIAGKSRCGWWDLEMGEVVEKRPGEF